MDPKCRMLIYGTNNIGDTIQAVAMSCLLPPTVGIRRDGPEYDQRPDLPTVVQGFLYVPLRERLGDNCLFAGINLYSKTPIQDFVPWLQASPWPVGVRDPWTAGRLQQAGIQNVKLLGCPTMTLPRYEGPRENQLAVDAEGPGMELTHVGWRGLSMEDQWSLALKLLDSYRTAELVTTNRLHALLPALAFGTPVRFVRKQVFEPDRLTILDFLGLPWDGDMAVDLREKASVYISFLEEHLGVGPRSEMPKKPLWEKTR